MCWGFFWGFIAGGAVGVVTMGFVNAARDNKDYIELNHYGEKKVKNEVEE